MINKYNHKLVEEKWQIIWESAGMYRSEEHSSKPKKYVLGMFPYPSGDGLHLGHVVNYTPVCVYSRYMRAKGFNVMHPIGWDAFGLPSENYAIKTGTHPDISTHQNIKNFIVQMKAMGFSYDWSREIDTSSPEYYRWTQWFFLLLYKNGLAYKKKAKVNWCESCKTVLANEQAEGGVCDRCKNEVVQKDLQQWFFKITDFADALVDDLDNVDWPESTKINQRNWIGRSEGAEIEFHLEGHQMSFKVFTTRPDTLFGVTYLVLAPEHPLVSVLKEECENTADIDAYVDATKNKTELDRQTREKEKTGIELKGITAINPANKKKIPIFIADYVFVNYGTGAIMAVPAHDERDFEFAKKFNLPAVLVIEPETGEAQLVEQYRSSIVAIIEDPKNNQFLTLNWGPKFGGTLFIGGGREEGEDVIATALRELEEETGYTDIEYISQSEKTHHHYFAFSKNVARNVDVVGLHFKLKSDAKKETLHQEDEKNKFALEWLTKTEIFKHMEDENHLLMFKRLILGQTYTGKGILTNSGPFDGMKNEEAKQKITEFVGGKLTKTYKLRDWLVSRQRYWGAPIPIVYDPDGKPHPIPEEHLPWLLPTDVEFRPTGTSPLGQSKELFERTEKIFGAGWKPEIDTLDTFVCSSWYYFRFTDPHNTDMFASKESIEKWLPVDMYMGGAEHTVLHLMYARFFTKVLKKLGYINFDEPFMKLRHQGMILAEDGRKMSKSLGNVINPNGLVETYGADTLRLHEMFLGPLEDMKAWNSQTIIGPRRFLERVWRMREKIKEGSSLNDLEIILNKTIKKVGEDIESFSLNTAISSLMILVNKMEKCGNVSRADYETLLILLAPFAPHITEELWHDGGNKNSIHVAPWPTFDVSKCIEIEATIVVQVNGKVRDTIVVRSDIDDSTLKEIVLARPVVVKWINGKSVKKVMVVKGKLVSIVV